MVFKCQYKVSRCSVNLYKTLYGPLVLDKFTNRLLKCFLCYLGHNSININILFIPVNPTGTGSKGINRSEAIAGPCHMRIGYFANIGHSAYSSIYLIIFPGAIATNDSESGTIRHIMIDGFKPALFGSYNYDPIRQVFDISPKQVNGSLHGMSTVISNLISTTNEIITTDSGNLFRHRAQLSNSSANWWDKLSNAVVSKHNKI